jgi:flagellar motility protein MotE (MotC chaperone)
MKQFLTLTLTALVMFAGAAAVSYLLQRSKMPPAENETAQEKKGAETGEQDGKTKGPSSTTEGKAAVRSSAAPGAEEVARMAANLRDRLNAVSEKEAQLAAQKKQLDLVYEDIRNERSAMEELRKKMQEELKTLEEKIALFERKHAESGPPIKEKAASDLEKLQQKSGVGKAESGNAKKMADVVGNMPPKTAAELLKQLVETGKMESAVKMLNEMTERQAAKVLAELADPMLAAQLLDKLKESKRPPAPNK